MERSCCESAPCCVVVVVEAEKRERWDGDERGSREGGEGFPFNGPCVETHSSFASSPFFSSLTKATRMNIQYHPDQSRTEDNGSASSPEQPKSNQGGGGGGNKKAKRGSQAEGRRHLSCEK